MPIINADYSVLTEKLTRTLKVLCLKLIIESELLSKRICLVKVLLKNDPEKYLISIVC